MKRIAIATLCLLASFGAMAQKAIDVISVSDIFDLITYRYITLANEDVDAQAVIDNYVPVFTAYGYIHELPGDGYGGPCAIIDGFYKGGYNDTENYTFVPTDPDGASMVMISACNAGDDSDYGYITVSVHVYSEAVLLDIMDQMQMAGFELFQYDDPDEAGDELLFYNGDQSIRITPVEDGAIVTFEMAE